MKKIILVPIIFYAASLIATIFEIYYLVIIFSTALFVAALDSHFELMECKYGNGSKNNEKDSGTDTDNDHHLLG